MHLIKSSSMPPAVVTITSTILCCTSQLLWHTCMGASMGASMGGGGTQARVSVSHCATAKHARMQAQPSRTVRASAP